MKKILFLAANPKTTTSLQLRTEANKIHDSLQKAGAADKFQLIDKWAVDSATLRRTLLDEKPDIVHFSGHGTGAEGLVLVGQDDKPRPATGDALASLFKIVNEIKPVRCVLLNACYAEEQARAIFQHIDNVIGMRREVKDDAAIAFSVGFYDGLARQLPTRTAFDLGCTAIQFELASFSQGTRKAIVVLDEAKEVLEPIPDHLIPILFSRESDAVASASVQAPSFSEALKEDGIGKEEALKQYRERVKEFLDDRELTPIEEFQLATLASTLGLSEAEVNQIRLEEQHRIEQARENYKKVLTQTINKGFYPLDEKIQAQLKELQKTLDLMDFDVEEISQPILKLAEKDYRAKQLQQAQQEYEQKLQRYEQEFSQAIAAQYLVNEQKNQEHCKSILENLGSQLSTILNCSMVDLSYELDKCLGQFLSSRLKIIFLGEFKRGKSALINAILGAEILPAYSMPCTAVLTEVKWGEHPQAILHYLKSEEKLHRESVQINLESVEEYIVFPKDWSDNYVNPYEKVEIFYPLEFYRSGIEIIDTSGLNEYSTRSQIIENYLPVVDLFVFVLTCEALASQSEIRFIENLRRSGIKNLFFVCNKFDQIRSKEKASVVKFALSKLVPLTQLGKKGIFFVSAYNALEGRLEDDTERVLNSGILDFEREIKKFCLKTNRLKLSSFASKLAMLISSAKEQNSKHHEIMQQTKFLIEEDDLKFHQLRQNIKTIDVQLDQVDKQLREVCESRF